MILEAGRRAFATIGGWVYVGSIGLNHSISVPLLSLKLGCISVNREYSPKNPSGGSYHPFCVLLGSPVTIWEVVSSWESQYVISSLGVFEEDARPFAS